MATLPRWVPTVCSDLNLMTFRMWMQKQDQLVAEDHKDLFMIIHEDPPVPAFIRHLLDTDVYNIWPTIMVNGTKIHIPRRPCTKIGCERCGVKGGYKFHWLGPWTCAASVHPSINTANDARHVWQNCTKCKFCKIANNPTKNQASTNAADSDTD